MFNLLGIRTITEYVQFYLDLGATSSIPLARFVNNERSVLKHKLETNQLNREAILQGIKILDVLKEEIQKIGQDKVIEKYSKNLS